MCFTAPGTYAYTVKERTPSDRTWKTDPRVYRVVVTVTESENKQLEAQVDYPDGFPKFLNTHKHCPPPPPPSDVCKYFHCLPFPMLWFAPPQKPEFVQMMASAHNAFEKWEAAVRLLQQYGNNPWWWDAAQERWRNSAEGIETETNAK